MQEEIKFVSQTSRPFEFASVVLTQEGVTIHGNDGGEYLLAETCLYEDSDRFRGLGRSELRRRLQGARMQVDDILSESGTHGLRLEFVDSAQTGSVNEFVDGVLSELLKQLHPPRR